MPPAVALLNYISCGILWRIFCQTGIFAGFSLYIKLTINAPLILKMRDIIIKCGIGNGEIVEGIEEGGCEETFLFV